MPNFNSCYYLFMNIQITSDNIEITPSMKVLAEEKTEKIIARLKDHPEDLISLRVVLNKGEAADTFDAKVETNIAGTSYFASSTAFNLESALIDSVADVLRQFDRDKSKTESTDWQERRNMKVYISDEE